MQITNVITVDNNIRIDNGINGLIDFIAFTTLSSTIGCMKKIKKHLSDSHSKIFPTDIPKSILDKIKNMEKEDAKTFIEKYWYAVSFPEFVLNER